MGAARFSQLMLHMIRAATCLSYLGYRSLDVGNNYIVYIIKIMQHIHFQL